MTRVKYWRVGGKGVTNPSPDTPDTIKMGADHFQHHCQICHGLDGHGTGVPIVTRTSPPVADLGSARVQRYTDGQLKWIIDNCIRFSGMPGWKGILSDDESWASVRYIRHLPAKGSLGAPKVFQEEEEEHEHGTEMQGEHAQLPDHGRKPQHQQPNPH
jgi:mono/diheme cytochrome c family protein